MSGLMGKIDLWTQTILSVDTLGLVLRVFVTAVLANAKVVNGYSNESTRWAKQSLVAHRSMVGLTVSHSCGDGRLPLDCSGGATTKANQRICLA